MALNDKAMPSSIIRLSRISNFVLLCMFALAITDYAIIYTQIKDTITNFKVIDYSYRRTAEIQKACYNVRSLIMLNEGML